MFSLNVWGFDLETLFKSLVLVCGLLDGHKYFRQSQKIRRKKTSGSVSRFFAIEAFSIDIVLTAWVIYKQYPILTVIRGLALITTAHLYWTIYLYYPYKNRKKKKFKRPTFWKFLKNTLTPNDKTKRL